MTDEREHVPSPDWLSKLLATIDAISGYTFSALAIAGALILLLPSPIVGTDMIPFRVSWGGWIVAGTIVAALLAASKIVRSVQPWIGNILIKRSASKAQGLRQAEVLAFLDTLSAEERELISWCLEQNQRSVVGNHVSLPALLSGRGVFVPAPGQFVSPMRMPYVIPDFVWAELRRRRAEFQTRNRRAKERSW